MRLLTAAAMSIVVASLSLNAPAHAQSSSGISLLSQVTQIKTDNANEEAMESADRQRELIRQQQAIREQQRRLEASREGATPQADARVAICRTCVAQTASSLDADED